MLGTAYPGKDALVGRIDSFLDSLPELMAAPAPAVVKAAALALSAEERNAA